MHVQIRTIDGRITRATITVHNEERYSVERFLTEATYMRPGGVPFLLVHEFAIRVDAIQSVELQGTP